VAAPLRLRFVTSADDLTRLPTSTAELAVAGRSNVGKSSLLNALSGGKQPVAKTSKTPGRTQLLNCFALEDGTTVVDLPGYGYAKVPANVRGRWQRMIEGYLTGRDALKMVLVLVDGEVGPRMLDWLRAEALPHTVIATKHDKVRPSRRQKRKTDLAAACDLEPSDVVWVSAAKNVNIDRLRQLCRDWLAL
jgi:GTP-binding protein